MKSALRIFFLADNTRPAIVLACLVLAGFAEAIGLTTILPAVTQVTGGVQEASSPLNGQVMALVEHLGIPASVTNLILLVVAFLSLKVILSFLALSYVGYSVANVSTGMRARLVDALLKVRWSYFSDQRVGRIANAMSNDATRAGKAYFGAARLVTHCVQMAFYTIVALQVSPRLAAVGLTIGGAMAAAMSVLTRISRKAGYRQTDRTSDLVVYLSDALNNIKPLKTMERKDAFVRMFSRKLKSVRRALRTQVLARHGMVYGEEIIIFVCLGVGLYGATVIWHIPMPELIVMGLLFHNVINGIGKVQQFAQSVMELESAYFRLRSLTEDAAINAEQHAGTRHPGIDCTCRFDKVTFAHADRPVVTEATFEVPAGGITVLQGPSGAGKTTLIDLLTGLYQPDSGRILVGDTPLDDIDMAHWRAMIGYVPQELTLFHDTIFMNVTLGDDRLGEDAVRAALEQAGAWALVDGLPDGMMTIVGEHGTRFSGGERQRIALARALVADPKLLILDEVTSALDPDTEKTICDNIQALSGRYTIVAITHRPAWSSIATNLYAVEDGRVTRVERAAHLTKAV